jgi:hypothetical protein
MGNPDGAFSVYDGGEGVGSIGRWRGYSALKTTSKRSRLAVVKMMS